MENFLDTDFDTPTTDWCGCYGPSITAFTTKSFFSKLRAFDNNISLVQAYKIAGTIILVMATLHALLGW